MKKYLLMLAVFACTISASAFDFDGINLNNSVSVISRQISQKGYAFDAQSNALTGNCQGTKIYLTLNYNDVNTKGKLGQLIVNVPMKEKNAFESVAEIFNVVYHLVGAENGTKTYIVSEDGTTLDLAKTADGIKLIYSTPYYYVESK